MASSLKKFQLLEQEQQQQGGKEKPADPSPAKKSKLSMLSMFESGQSQGERRKNILRQREIDKKQKEKERLEVEKRKLEEELELKRRQKEEEDKRQLKLREEEEERKRIEEERKKEAEAEEQRRKEWEKKEGKYVGLKPAAAMFQRALDAKDSVQRSMSGGDRKVTTLRKGTISEIRSKIFDQKNLEKSKSDTQVKPAPKKVIIPSINTVDSTESKAQEPKVQNIKEVSHPEPVTQKLDVQEGKKPADMKSEQLERNNLATDDKSDENSSKRKSFINDFAALEKTYKILGISKESALKYEEVEQKAPVKKRHNSEGKIKNKDKAKAQRKSVALSEVESESKDKANKEETAKELPKIDRVLNVQNKANRSFFQERINVSKGLVKKEPELLGPRLRKKGSLVNAFEQNYTDSDKLNRKSQVIDDVRVDSQKFNSFLNKFEGEEGKDDARAQMIKITKQQKEYEIKKRIKEQKNLEEKEAMKKAKEEEQNKAIQDALEEELKKQQRMEEEDRQARIKAVEEEFTKLEREEDEEAEKKKESKKKKKVKKAEVEIIDTAPKIINLQAGDVSNTRSMFEKRKKSFDETKEPLKPNRIKKIANNPFENMMQTDQPLEKEVKVNKLKRNTFMEQLEKGAQIPQEVKKTTHRAVPLKKISGEASIKFESKKEKKPDENQEVASFDRKPEVRVSKSIEGPHPVNKSSKEKKSGSTKSLHKIFIDGPKEFFKSSKEKLYKLSKETLCEVNEKQEKQEAQSADKKPSRSEMQNYLLSHVLFDGKEVAKKEKVAAKKEELEDIDDVENYLDDEYRHKIEQYCSLLEDEKPKRKKKKKTTKAKKQEEKLPTIKRVEIKAIQEQLQQQLGKPTEKKTGNNNDDVFVKHESQVNKFKGMFDNETKDDADTKPMLGQSNRKGLQNKSDIFLKIKALENAEKDRIERERQNEERIQYLLQKEMARQRENEAENKAAEDSSEEEAEEELKQNILQCLEDEVDNLEQEMLALDTQEKMIIDEEQETFMSDENEVEVVEHKVQLHEIHEEIVERKKNAADKKRKVMERFQHVLDANDDDEDDGKPQRKQVGKLHDRMKVFNSKTEEPVKRGFEDTALVGISSVMSKVKDKFEAQEDKQAYLLSRDEVKRKANPTALKFEMMSNDEELLLSPTQKKTDWTWKNKTAAELETELSGYNDNENDPANTTQKAPKKNYQEAKFSELSSEINAIKERMTRRDLERENERKIQEMEELIGGVQESLKQHEKDYGLEYDEDDYEEPEEIQPKRKMPKKKDKVQPLEIPSFNKIENLRNQLLNNDVTLDKNATRDKTEVDVSVAQIRKKIVEQSTEIEQGNNELEQRSAKRAVSTNIISKLCEILPTEGKEDELQLRKAPKMVLKSSTFEDECEAPVKTLEELKAEKENKKWAWKETNLSDLQNFIKANDEIAPKMIVSQQKNLKDLEEEEKVVESIHGSKDADILVQIREEKEREFNEFMAGVKSYLKEDTKTTQEEEFKEGMQSYLDLIDSDRKEAVEEDKKPLIRLNSIGRLKNSLLEVSNDVGKEKLGNDRVKKLETSKFEAVLQQSESSRPKPLIDNVIAPDQTLLVKRMFEEKERSPNKSPIPTKNNSTRSSFAERFAKRAREEKLKRLEHQVQYKQKTINDLHSYIENNEALATETLLKSLRESKIRKEEEKLIYHEVFMDTVNSFLKDSHQSEEQNIFMGNIRAYLTILENVESMYNATPKLRKHRGSTSQSNMRRAIIEKSVERPKQAEEPNAKKELKKPLTEEEKRKEILTKYGLKDRSKMAVEAISDVEDASEEEDVRELTDKELCEKYRLPYVPDSSELYSRDRSDSASSFTGLLSKIRQATAEKAQTISSTKKVFEKNEVEDNKELIKSPTVKLRKRFDSECSDQSRSSSPVPSYDPGSKMTDKIKRRFEEQRRSLVDDEVDAINTFGQRSGVLKSGSTHKMKKMFENNSPTSSRTSSPILRSEAGSLVTSRMKQRFEEATSNRQSLIDDDSSADSRGCSPIVRPEPGSIITTKLRNRFEAGAMSPVNDVRPAFNRGVQKSSTIGDIGNMLSSSREPNVNANKVNLAEMYFQQDKATVKDRNVLSSPAVHRAQAIEKSKSFSKFKNAFESGKGLNIDSSDDDENFVDQKTKVNAELEALRTTAKSKSNINLAKTAVDAEMKKKQELAAAFFKPDVKKSPTGMRSVGPMRSSTVSDIGAYLRSSPEESTKSKPSPLLQTKIVTDSVKQENKEVKVPQSPQSGLHQSKSFSKFKNAFEDGVGVMDDNKKPSQKIDLAQIKVNTEIEALRLSSKIQEIKVPKGNQSPRLELQHSFKQEVKEPKNNQSPQLGVQHSQSFSKFKTAFEDGVGVMDDSNKPSQLIDNGQRKVNAEIEALKSSSKIQNMFRINKSKTIPDSPKMERRQSRTPQSSTDLDEDTIAEVAKSRSAISNMFESQGPKMTFGGGPKAEKTPESKPKPSPKKKEEGNMNERKWVFDTIQKYFDVIVEEEKEDEEDDEEDEDNDDGEEGEDEDNSNGSDSEYTDAEDELPEIDLPPPRERSGTLPLVMPLSPLVKPKELPRLALPSVQRTSSLRLSPRDVRASTVSPAVQLRRQPETKVSTKSINDIIDDAAKQFDQMTDGSDLSLDQSPRLTRAELARGDSASTLNRLQKSNSSHRIRGMLQSVVHGSNTSLDVTTFKSNLQAHLSNSRAGSRATSLAPQGNRDPGVDDSSSDYSEYD